MQKLLSQKRAEILMVSAHESLVVRAVGIAKSRLQGCKVANGYKLCNLDFSNAKQHKKPLWDFNSCRGFFLSENVEMIFMNEDQKTRIISLRQEGRSYSQIATALNLSENTVKSVCRRSAKVSKEELIAKSADCCKNCGVSLKIRNFGKPAKFCSDTCRREWWKNNNSSPNRKAYYPVRCLGCDKEFLSYGNEKRKYCAHACYINKQFKSGGETNDARTI